MNDYRAMHEAVISGDAERVIAEVTAAIARGTKPLDVIADGLNPPMAIVGQHMQTGEMFIPEVLLSAEAMQSGMNVLKPLLASADIAAMRKGKVLIGTVEGDIHYLGKNLVAMMLDCAGFEIVDLGEDVPAAVFVDAVRREQPRVLAMSSLMTTTMSHMKDVVDALCAAQLRANVKIIVGGAPVTQVFAESIGVDAYAQNASVAVEHVLSLAAT